MFHPRRPPAVVRQSGSGRTTLHLDMGAAGVTAPAAASSSSSSAAAAAAAAEAGGAAGQMAGASGRDSTISGLSDSAAGQRSGRGTAAGGLRGRRGWWGVTSRRRIPPFLEFWGLSSAAETSEATGQRRWRQAQQQRRQQNSVWFRSPEFLIFVLGLAALMALIVFVTDMLSNRPFRPMAVLVFVTAGTYCVALARQQRIVAAAEQALVIEIIDGSAADTRRTVISKEDRRALFYYFKHRPTRPHREERASSNALEAGDPGGLTSGEAGLPAPAQTPPQHSPCSPAAAAAEVVERGGVKGAQEPNGGCQVLDCTMADAESVMLAPSSGAAAGFPPGLPVASGAVEAGGGVGAGGEDRRSGSQAVVPGNQELPAAMSEESKESEVPVRGTARGNSEQWSTAGSCIVCFGEYADGDELCRLPCRHTYHAECIDAWLDGPDHAWCPLCKSSLLPTVPPEGSTGSAAPAADATDGHNGSMPGVRSLLVDATRINSEASVRALLGAASASTTAPSALGQDRKSSSLGPAPIAAARAGNYDCITPLVEAGAVFDPDEDASGDWSPSCLILEPNELGQCPGVAGIRPGNLVEATEKGYVTCVKHILEDDYPTMEADSAVEVSKAQLAKLHVMFENIDVSKSGTVYCSEILSVVDMAQSPFTDNLFKLVGVHPDGSLTFSQLCRILMTYCVFSKEEILLFLFRQYDTDNSGAIDEREFRELAKTVNNASPMFPGNFAKALLDFDTNSDGLIDFDEFRAMDKAFPLLFFPAFRLQDSLQKQFLGSSFWLKTQEGVLAREGIAEYQATHGGKAPERGRLR
eukprot:g4886.t1